MSRVLSLQTTKCPTITTMYIYQATRHLQVSLRTLYFSDPIKFELVLLAGLPSGSVCWSVVVTVGHSIGYYFLVLVSLEGILIVCLVVMGSQRDNVELFLLHSHTRCRLVSGR